MKSNNLIQSIYATLFLHLIVSTGSHEVIASSAVIRNFKKDSLSIMGPLIDDADPLFRRRATATMNPSSRNTFSMGYHSYYSYSMPIATIRPTKSPSKKPPSPSTMTTRPSLLSSLLPPSSVSSKPSLSTRKPTPFPPTQIPSSHVDIMIVSNQSMKPTLRPTLWYLPTRPYSPNTTTSNTNTTGTNESTSIGFQGGGGGTSNVFQPSTPPKSKINLTPYIISATIASVVGFVSVTALILSRRNRIEPLLFSEDLEEDDSLDTVSFA